MVVFIFKQCKALEDTINRWSSRQGTYKLRGDGIGNELFCINTFSLLRFEIGM